MRIAFLFPAIGVAAVQGERIEKFALTVQKTLYILNAIPLIERAAIVQHHSEPAAWLDHAHQLPQRSAQVRRMMQDAPGISIIERPIGERQVPAVLLLEHPRQLE